ncbi:spg1 [Cucurbita argyrosperma subsp. argyrosperma]|nr:spg1 [Cucurbita argyrosperma subsp. argyrosperma]
MPQPCRKQPLRLSVKRQTALKRHAGQFLDSILACYSSTKPKAYAAVPDDAIAASTVVEDAGFAAETLTPSVCHDHGLDKDLVSLKISLLGDSQIGKTSFLVKYVGNELDEGRSNKKSQDYIPTACKDSVAILFMFDLTSRRTLTGIVKWYRQARKYNQFITAKLFDLPWTVERNLTVGEPIIDF